MKIILHPSIDMRSLSVSIQADVLILNGESFDFSALPEGGTLPAAAIDSGHFAGPVSRIEGELQICLIMPISGNASETARFPQPIHVTEDGPVALPE